MNRLRTVPDAPPRAVLYLRQSISREDSISLELQETAGRDFCRQTGYEVVGVLADPGISGRTWKRAAVVETMRMVEAGDADVIVLWKWSRLSRSRRDWAVAVDKVESMGGRIESSTEQVDVTTATGRFARGMLAEFAAFESDRIGEVWQAVHASRLAEGLAPTGKPKFGYAWDRDAKIHRPDPETGPVLAEAYARYVAGESFHTLVRWLNSAGVRTTAGGLWSDRSLRRVMDAGFAAGWIPWRGELHPGAHDALIDADLWQAYTDAREARRSTPARVKRSRYVLSGLVRCGRCQGPMVANVRYGGRTSSYRCSRAKAQGPRGCTAGYVGIEVVEEAVLGWLRALAVEDVDKAKVDAAGRVARRVDREAEARRAARELAKKDEAIVRLTRHLGEEVIGLEEFRAARAEIEAEKAVLAERVEAFARQARAVVEDRPALARDLLARWTITQVETRRAGLERLIDHVLVTTGNRSGVKGVQGGASNARIDVVER